VDEIRIPPAGDPFTAARHHDDEDHPHACLEGYVFITYEDEYGEEREASYRCRRCEASKPRSDNPCPQSAAQQRPADSS
jgi:hypothetical protein